MNATTSPEQPGLLGDTSQRDYARKLRLFNAFAEPELRQAIASLDLRPGMRVLDAGCGTGETLQWLAERVGPENVVGVDLADAHVAAARAIAPLGVSVLQGDVRQVQLPTKHFDLIWCVNTLHHLHDPLEGLNTFTKLIRPGARIALGQSSFLPDMYFAWDARLERLTNEAVRRYYRERYGIVEQDLTAVRAIVGLLRKIGLQNVSAKTFTLERVSPLKPADRDYLLEAIFRGTWGERLRPYMEEEDHIRLTRLCDPQAPEFALDRPEFHFIQTFTLAVGSVLDYRHRA